MEIKVSTELLDKIHYPTVTYLKKEYLMIQKHPDLLLFEDQHHFQAFSKKGKEAVSLNQSPFGSVFLKHASSQGAFSTFEKHVSDHLRAAGIHELIVRHPPSIYKGFVKQDWLKSCGFQVRYEDINQHIDLSEHWEDRLHKMQERKLKSLRDEGFTFAVMPSKD